MLLTILFPIACLVLLVIYAWVMHQTRRFILPPAPNQHFEYCLVLGAGLERDGRATDILMDRVCTAVDLYKQGKADRLIMSGACRPGYDEPGAMRTAALAQAVPDSAIILDNQGISTLDSCLNFQKQYGGEVLIVSQTFHLPRAVFLARRLGLPAYGLAAHFYHFKWYKRTFWRIREILALPYNFIKFGLNNR
ncbi:MAG: hypothetical protein PWQ55_297 [Chloroflexota bacterium]|nr:hypothetical protein [Chloroflexota bacterium]